jgi:predicted ATPase
MFKGEIRDSDIAALTERVRRRGYQKYLTKMRLVKLRNFRGAEISFDFPVTALVGPNGAGKTTTLGAAALIYESVKPRRFFAKSGDYDSSMRDWRIEYEIIDKSLPQNTVTRTASYLRAKWNRDAVARQVEIFGVARTLPASERKDTYKFIGGDFVAVNEVFFSEEVLSAVEKILGKDAANYLQVDADRSGKVSILAARSDTEEEMSYSEFHFGAGEASVIRIVSRVEASPEESLIIIEEIENGLHPVATRRLVEYLIDVAKRKSCQVIFTTHSDDALAPLPNDAVWSAYLGQLKQGKLDVSALRTLNGQINARLAIFTEDTFDELVADVTLRAYGQNLSLDRSSIQIHRLGGAAPARDHTRFHNANPTRSFPAICLLDGDKEGSAGFEPKILQAYVSNRTDSQPVDTIFIPGEGDPESYIFEKIHWNLDTVTNLTAKLTVALQLDTPMQERVRESIIARKRTNRDIHVIFAQIGEDLDFLSESVVQRAFVSTWAYAFPEDVSRIWDPCRLVLPTLISEAN